MCGIRYCPRLLGAPLFGGLLTVRWHGRGRRYRYRTTVSRHGLLTRRRDDRLAKDVRLGSPWLAELAGQCSPLCVITSSTPSNRRRWQQRGRTRLFRPEILIRRALSTAAPSSMKLKIAASAKGAATKLTSPVPKLATAVATAVSIYEYIVVDSVMRLVGSCRHCISFR
jgi:hypothetical protein